MYLLHHSVIGSTAELTERREPTRLVLQVFTFIGVSVTNVLACNSPGAPAISETERKRRNVASQTLQSNALFSSACCGIACTVGCVCFGAPLLRLMGASEDMLPLALPYLHIRSAAAPAVMIMNACQGAFLGQQNTVAPLAIFVVAAPCNALLGAFFVLGRGWGLPGAALATVIVQVRH
jgi:Na+-driven multidrug efflux pump